MLGICYVCGRMAKKMMIQPRDQKQKAYASLGRRNQRKDRITRSKELALLKYYSCYTDPVRGRERRGEISGSPIPPGFTLSPVSPVGWTQPKLSSDQLSSHPENSRKRVRNASEGQQAMGWPRSSDPLRVKEYYSL